MIFNVCVTARASSNRIEQNGNKLKVYLTKPAAEGQANAQLVSVLSAYFKIKKYQLRIKNGNKSRHKLIEIDVGN